VACGTLSNATTYSFSCFIKTPTNSLTSVWLYVSDGGNGTGTNRWGVEINLSNFTLMDYTAGNGSVTSKAVENYGNGWYRVRVTGQVTSGMSGSSVAVVRKLIAGADTNGINGVLVWGAQVETGSVATSYIPTTAAAVTRNAEVVTLSGAVSGCIGQTEGTIYAEVDIRTSGNTAGIFVISDNTNTNRVYLYKLGTNNRIYAERQSATESATSTLQTSGSITAGIYKIAIAYKSGDTALFVNGVQAGSTNTDTFTMGSVFKLNVGSNRAEATQFNDRIRAAALYTTRLTDSELAALTTL
jgi:hypothetical protein